MNTKSMITLNRFFVFNSTLASVEGEEEKKILYYYPADVDVDTQIKSVGLCEAVIKFARTFNSNESCEAMHTQKTRQLFFEAEPNFWMIMVVTIPFVQKMKDTQVYVEYHGDDVQDNIFQAILRQAYQMFKFFMGSFDKILSNSKLISQLKQKLDHFYSRYLLTLKLNDADVLDAFQGIYFLPLDKHNFLKIQFFVNQLETLFSQICYVAFLYNDQLVWSGLEQDDMQIMYKYLTTSLFPAYMEAELQSQPAASTRNQITMNCCHYGKFITGPPNINDSSRMGKVPRVCVNTSLTCEECYLIVYRALSATVCLLVDAQHKLNFEWYKKLDSFLGPNMTTLATEIDEHYGKRSSGISFESQFKYIYFNHMNLAQKSTVHMDIKRTGSIVVASEIMKLLGDINADLARLQNGGEIIVRTMNDCWVVGKFSDQREFYVIINQKNANLIEVNEEMKKLCSTHFSNIFILD